MKEGGELPWGMVPVLQTLDGTIAESSAILRFAGRLAGLVPEDSYQCAKADEFIDGMEPLSKALDSTFGISSVDERIRLRKEVFGPSGKGTQNLILLEGKVAESETGWAAGTDEMSIADLKLFTGLFGLFSGNYDGIDASVISEYPGLIGYHEKVATEPRIKAHYADVKAEDIRWTFLPGAFDGQ
jgi:glutathione S-transferase